MIGKQVGRYRITGEIGRGGMGVVYRATQVTLNRTVAVKMLPERLASSEEYLSRFRREAETLARLAHPNIVHIYDVEEAEGSHFIVMEFVDGPSLTDLMARERLSVARARDIAHALADGLSAAHRKGIIHRDIKPDNILFNEEGRPKLTDFGIAHMRDSNVRTQTGVMLGTPYYMSPEQAGGKPVTAASDVYSLGIVLYEMLCGRVPFDADTPVAVALKHLNEIPAPLERIVPELPGGLCRIVERALAKDPVVRFKSALEFQSALGDVDLGRPSGSALLGRPSRERVELGACPACAAPLRAEFITCPSCGTAVREQCGLCGELYAVGLARCPSCREARTPSPAAGAPAGPSRPAAPARPVAGGADAAAPAGPREGLAAGLGGLRAAGQAFAGAVAEVAQKSAEAADRAIDAAGRAAGAAGRAASTAPRPPDIAEPATGRRPGPPAERRGPAADLAGRARRALEGRMHGVPVPMLLGLGLVGLALLLALLQALLVGESGGTLATRDDPGAGATFGAGPAPEATPASGGGTRLGASAGGRGPTRITPEQAAAIGRLLEGEEERPPEGPASPAAGPGGAAAEPARPAESEGEARPAAEAAAGRGAEEGAADPIAPPPTEPEERAPDRPVEPAGEGKGAEKEEAPTSRADDEGLDAEAARREIAAVVERQRRATETGDLALFLRDLAPDLHEESRDNLRELHEAVDSVRSVVRQVRVEFADAETATARVQVVLSVQRPRQKRWVTAFDGWVVWELSRIGGRWVITDVYD